MNRCSTAVHSLGVDGECQDDAQRIACSKCNLRDLCVPGGIPQQELEKLDSVVSLRRRVKRGEALFRAGDEFKSLFAVRRGFFKVRLTRSDGHDQITGFQVPGEILGLDALAVDRHNVDAIALEDSEVCVLPYSDIERISRELPALQQQLHRVMSREIVREQGVMMLLGSMRAEQRVAAYLINLSERYRRLGYSPREFVLRMTRGEIGSYLGLKLETVSRSFSKLQESGLIDAKGKQITLKDVPKLREIVETGC